MSKNKKLLFYGHQKIDNDDIKSVTDALRGQWLTTGPIVRDFENKISKYTGSKYTVVCSSGTAALILAYMALGKEYKNILIPSMTFVSTASAAKLLGKKVHLIDCNENTGLICLDKVEKIIRKKKIDVIVPVHMNGKSVDLERLSKITKNQNIAIIDDASHAIGSEYFTSSKKKLKVGSSIHTDLTVFSFHPVKNITTGEGGAVTTNDKKLYEKLISFRNHGIEKNKDRILNKHKGLNSTGQLNQWYYEVHEIGFNFRLSDLNCALGLSQLKKLEYFKKQKLELVSKYYQCLADMREIIEVVNDPKDKKTSWHLFVIKIKFMKLKESRDFIMKALYKKGIQTQVHYIPIHFHPYYNKEAKQNKNLKGTESYYNEILTLPLHPDMKLQDVKYVTDSLKEIICKIIKK